MYAVLKRDDKTYSAIVSNTYETPDNVAFSTTEPEDDAAQSILIDGDVAPAGDDLVAITGALADTNGFP